MAVTPDVDHIGIKPTELTSDRSRGESLLNVSSLNSTFIMKTKTSASSSVAKSTNLTIPAPSTDAAYGEFLDKLKLELLKHAKRINWQKGGKLSIFECEDAAIEMLEEFDKRYKEGVYDSSRQTPVGYMYKYLQGKIQEMIRKKEQAMRVESEYAEKVEQADDLCTFIPAAEISRSREEYLKKMYAILWDELSESDRKIVGMKAKGLKNQQIAEELGLNYGAATKRICILRDKLEAKLKANGYHGLLARVR